MDSVLLGGLGSLPPQFLFSEVVWVECPVQATFDSIFLMSRVIATTTNLNNLCLFFWLPLSTLDGRPVRIPNLSPVGLMCLSSWRSTSRVISFVPSSWRSLCYMGSHLLWEVSRVTNPPIFSGPWGDSSLEGLESCSSPNKVIGFSPYSWRSLLIAWGAIFFERSPGLPILPSLAGHEVILLQ